MSSLPPDRFRSMMVRGTLFNALGLAAKLIRPLLFVLLTWLFGPRLMAPYLLASFLAELIFGGLVSGYADATTILASQDADGEQRDEAARIRVYRVIANGLVVTCVLTVFAGCATHLLAGPLLTRYLPDFPELLPGLYLLVWSLLPKAISQIAIAAGKARFRMEYDAYLNGIMHPLLLLALCLAVFELDLGFSGVFGAHLLTEASVAAAALWVLRRDFDLTHLRHALSRFHFDRAMFGFAWPQSVNLTLNRYITRIDALMLAALGAGAVQVAYYSTAVLLTSNLRQVRLVFSGALAPVAARHHRAGDRAALERAIGESTRWATSIIVPIVLLLVFWRSDILRLVDPAYGDLSPFVVILLLPPLLGTTLGMAGNALVFTGHTGWTLTNSAFVAAINTALNWLLIPRLGLTGAAIATSIAVTLVALLQVVELRVLEDIHLRLLQFWKPLAGLLVGGIGLLALWDPGALDLATRVALSLGGLLGYVGLMLLLRHEDLAVLVVRWTSRA